MVGQYAWARPLVVYTILRYKMCSVLGAFYWFVNMNRTTVALERLMEIIIHLATFVLMSHSERSQTSHQNYFPLCFQKVNSSVTNTRVRQLNQ